MGDTDLRPGAERARCVHPPGSGAPAGETRDLGDWSVPCDRPLSTGEAGLFTLEPGVPTHVATGDAGTTVRLSVEPGSGQAFFVEEAGPFTRAELTVAEDGDEIHASAYTDSARVAVSVRSL